MKNDGKTIINTCNEYNEINEIKNNYEINLINVLAMLDNITINNKVHYYHIYIVNNNKTTYWSSNNQLNVYQNTLYHLRAIIYLKT